MSSHRLITLLAGFTAVGIALAVDDVLSALTCAYNLLVGGMLVPLLCDLLAPRHHAYRHRQHVARLRRGHRFHDQGRPGRQHAHLRQPGRQPRQPGRDQWRPAPTRPRAWMARAPRPGPTEFSSSRSKT
ncbi:hypothetical protein WJ970_06200 [Achromobacter xylosoxidans]